MNTTRNKTTQSKNYLPTTTRVIERSYASVKGSTFRTRLQTTFLVLWTLAFVLIALSLGACSPGSHMKTSSIEYSSPETGSSNGPPEKISRASRLLYMAQEEIETQEPPETVSEAASGSVTLNPKRLITLSGVIDEQMFGHANKLVSLSDSGSGPIDIVIASPGGYISHGLMFIQAMNEVKAKGVTIRCYVTSLAASMAYNIFSQCSERYALPYATLLFHSPRISGQFTIDTQSARQLANDLTQLENILLKLIIPVMGIDRASGAWFGEAYNTERLFLATELVKESPTAWFTVVARIEGYPGTFPAPYGPSSGSSDLRRARTNPSIREAGR